MGVILAFVYLFSHTILEGELKGGDSGFAFHNVFWYSRWWPRLPLWYPLQGGGFSFTLSYPVAQAWLTVLLDRLTTLDLNQTFRAIYFAAYFFTGLGIYIFGAWRMRNQTIGLMAAIFYLILPEIYKMTRIGLFAYLLATMLIPWVFIFSFRQLWDHHFVSYFDWLSFSHCLAGLWGDKRPGLRKRILVFSPHLFRYPASSYRPVLGAILN